MSYAMPGQQQVVYQADPSHAENVQAVRERLWKVCGGLLHRRIQVRTVDGHVHEGIVVHIDGSHIYLSVTQNRGDSRAFFPPFSPFSPFTPFPFVPSSAILPLVLFDLLVITLLYA